MLNLVEAVMVETRSGRAGPMGGGALSLPGSTGWGSALVRSFLYAYGVSLVVFGLLIAGRRRGSLAACLGALARSSRYGSDARGARSAVGAQTGPERSNGAADRSNLALQEHAPGLVSAELDAPLLPAVRRPPRSTRQRLQSSLDDYTFEPTQRGHRFRQAWRIHGVALAAGEDAAPRWRGPRRSPRSS